MAKIISSRKKYVPVKDLKVYPSNKETIEVIPDDCNGTHRYRAQMCAGFVNGKTKYVDATDTDDVFKDCVIPATTFDKGPLQFEIDEQLNTTWYKE